MITKKLKCDKTYEIADIDAFCEHSRITDLYDEIVVQQCLDAAHDTVEGWLNRPLYLTNFVGILDEFNQEVFLPKPTVRAVTLITAEDEDYNEHSLTQNVDWKFDDVYESVRFLTNSSTEFTKLRRFKIYFTSGYCQETDPVPPAVVSAILMTAATLYENREDTLIGTQINTVPLDAKRLLRIHRRRPM